MISGIISIVKEILSSKLLVTSHTKKGLASDLTEHPRAAGYCTANGDSANEVAANLCPSKPSAKMLKNLDLPLLNRLIMSLTILSNFMPERGWVRFD